MKPPPTLLVYVNKNGMCCVTQGKKKKDAVYVKFTLDKIILAKRQIFHLGFLSCLEYDSYIHSLYSINITACYNKHFRQFSHQCKLEKRSCMHSHKCICVIAGYTLDKSLARWMETVINTKREDSKSWPPSPHLQDISSTSTTSTKMSY